MKCSICGSDLVFNGSAYVHGEIGPGGCLKIDEPKDHPADLIDDSEMVTITKEEYAALKKDVKFLLCLMAAGVDEWEGYEIAREMRGE